MRNKPKLTLLLNVKSCISAQMARPCLLSLANKYNVVTTESPSKKRTIELNLMRTCWEYREDDKLVNETESLGLH